MEATAAIEALRLSDEAQRVGDALGTAIAAVYDELELSAEDRLRATVVVERELLRLESDH